MALVHRFYDVWSGEVLVGGHDVRAHLHEVRSFPEVFRIGADVAGHFEYIWTS